MLGNVSDEDSSNRLVNVSVSTHGVTKLTDGNGSYEITAGTGNHVIVATKSGYDNFIGNVTLLPANITAINITLEAINVTPEEAGVGFYHRYWN